MLSTTTNPFAPPAPPEAAAGQTLHAEDSPWFGRKLCMDCFQDTPLSQRETCRDASGALVALCLGCLKARRAKAREAELRAR